MTDNQPTTVRLRRAWAAVIAVAAFLCAGNAHAMSSGCSYMNTNGGGSLPRSVDTKYFTQDFEANETISLRMNSYSGGGGTVNLVGDPGNTASTARNSVVVGANGEPEVSTSFEITEDGTWTVGFEKQTPIYLSYDFSCTAAPAPATDSDSAASDSGRANTVRSAARAQTDVLEKNLDSRIDAAFQAAAGRDIGTGSPSARFAAFADRRERFTLPGETQHASRGANIRQLAMLGAFDTSKIRLGAAEDTDDDPVRGPQDRESLASPPPVTLWGHGSYVALDNDFNREGSDNRYNGDAWGYTLGADYRIAPRLVAGLSLGYTVSDIDTTYNSGTYEETGWNVAPYLIARPNDNTTLSAVAGFSWGSVDQNQSGAVGDSDSSMWFVALRGSRTFKPIQTKPLDVTARFAVLAGHKTVDATTLNDGTEVAEDSANTRRLKPGLEMAYAIDAGRTRLQPFVNADLILDLIDETNGDRQAFSLGGGLRIHSEEAGLTGTLAMDRQFGRKDYKAWSLNGMVAYGLALGKEGEDRGTVSPFLSSDLHAAGNQSFGCGLAFTEIDGWLDGELSLTHMLYTSEDDDVSVEGETVGALHVTLDL